MKLHDPNSEEEENGFDDLIGRCLGLLDESDTDFDAMTDGIDDAAYAGQYQSIQKSLFLLLDDGLDDSVQPPGDLAGRTLNRMQSERRFREYHQEPMIYAPRWRLSDIAVAATIFIAMFAGTFPAMQRSKFMASNVACSTNLTQLWRGAEQYSTTYNAYPNVVMYNQQLPVGASLILMNHAGFLDDNSSLTCPCRSHQVQLRHLPKWSELQQLREEHHKRMNEVLAEAYAVHPGLTGPNGFRHMERQMIASFRSVVPMFGDTPPMDNQHRILTGNSRSHSGHGQNVVFADGHTKFMRSRSIGREDNDIYATQDGHINAPADPREMILVPADMRLVPR